MKLADGTLWTMPITLDVTTTQAKELEKVKKASLKDWEGNTVAVIDIDDIWTPDKEKEAKEVFGGDPEHPAVDYLKREAGDVYVGGKLRGVQLPPAYDYRDIRRTP